MRIAAIDLGTVTARLLIADVDVSNANRSSATNPNVSIVTPNNPNNLNLNPTNPNSTNPNSTPIPIPNNPIHEIERRMRITHLGEHLAETGVISPAAIERERAACKDFLSTIRAVEARDDRPVERIVAVATSAMRDARNSAEVCAALADVGLTVEVIGGLREAQLSFSGTLSGFVTTSEQSVLTVDVGGGSTEILLGTLAPARPPRILREQSFDIGSRRLTDCFLPNDPPSAEDIAQAEAWVYKGMRPFFSNFECRPAAMIAVAGTATTVVSVRDKMAVYDPWRVHGSRVEAEELAKVLNDLAKFDTEQRAACVGLEAGRAPVIIGGLITLRAVLNLAGLTSFLVSETDILHGLILSVKTAG
ncbi:MAG: hypothetical protein LBH56_03965 [Coriobacteriales bacterium]|jgi:exopolyphosphatase/guanosine-5'-triphosphate,3'-diphosphate pyrophosphatase|nr:hypothetical protein [Coriobacteriales bacterium]